MPTPVVDLETLLGEQSHRLRGVTWSNLADLGRTNIEQILQLARANSVARAMDEVDRAELRELRRGIDAIASSSASATQTKPILPRLRNELFQPEQRVRVYLGDTPGVETGTTWVDGVVAEVVKGYRADWDDASPNGGYHWRVTVKLDPTQARMDQIAFSTTEPRALLAADFDHLRQSLRDDPAFFAAFCANAFRPWHPLWCIERGLAVNVERMDMAAWLKDAPDPGA